GADRDGRHRQGNLPHAELWRGRRTGGSHAGRGARTEALVMRFIAAAQRPGGGMRGSTQSAGVLVGLCLSAVVDAGSQAPGAAAQLKQVAYIKASNPSEDAPLGCGGTLTGHAGNSSAVSADGTTIAMGAPHESSGAKGINGNQNDK